MKDNAFTGVSSAWRYYVQAEMSPSFVALSLALSTLPAALDSLNNYATWGHSPRVYSTGKFAVGVKTCGHYHSTRLKAVVRNWAHKVEHRVFGTGNAFSTSSSRRAK